MEKFRGTVGLAKVEVRWCGEFMDPSPLKALQFSGYVYMVPAAMVILQRKSISE